MLPHNEDINITFMGHIESISVAALQKLHFFHLLVPRGIVCALKSVNNQFFWMLNMNCYCDI